MFSNGFTTINNNYFYAHNIYNVDDNLSETKTVKLKLVVNKDPGYVKVFDNVFFDAIIKDPINDKPQVVQSVKFYTKHQISDEVTYQDIDYREDTYRFFIPREHLDNEEQQIQTNKSYAGRMRGRYLICDYTFDCSNNKQIKIPFIKTTYRYSML